MPLKVSELRCKDHFSGAKALSILEALFGTTKTMSLRQGPIPTLKLLAARGVLEWGTHLRGGLKTRRAAARWTR